MTNTVLRFLLIFTSTASLAMAAAAPAAPAAPVSLEDRVRALEAKLEKITQENGDLKKQLGITPKSAPTFVTTQGKETKLSIGGFVQANVETGGNAAPDSRWTGINSRFLLRRARFFVTGAFAEDFSFKVEADFGNNSLSAKTGLSGQLTDAYASWTKYPAASVRLGQFKTPFGFEQLQSDTKIYTIERSLPNDSLTLGRQIGAMVYGDVAQKRLSYSIGTYNGTGTNIGSNDNQKFMWVGRVNGVVLDTTAGKQKLKITAGGDYFSTEDKGTFTGRRDGTSFDAQVAYGPAEFQGEWLQNERHPLTGAPVTMRGWAALGAYNFNPKWQGVLRYENYDSNTATDNTTTTSWTYGVNYLIKGDDLKLSLDYIVGRQPSPAPQGERLIGRLQIMF